MTSAERAETVAAIAQAGGADEIDQNRLDSVLASGDRGALNGLLAAHRVEADDIESLADRLVEAFSHLVEEFELPALIDALDAKFIPPVSGGDLIRNPESLPTGRNIHGFDPFRLPSAFALIEGERQAKQLLDRHLNDSGTLPTSVALVLWGTDN